MFLAILHQQESNIFVMIHLQYLKIGNLHLCRKADEEKLDNKSSTHKMGILPPIPRPAYLICPWGCQRVFGVVISYEYFRLLYSGGFTDDQQYQQRRGRDEKERKNNEMDIL